MVAKGGIQQVNIPGAVGTVGERGVLSPDVLVKLRYGGKWWAGGVEENVRTAATCTVQKKLNLLIEMCAKSQ